MPTLRLTQQILPTLAAQSGRDTFYWDTELTGFAVKVTSGGQRSYIVQSRIHLGVNKRRIKLNHCERMSLKEAREEARKLLASMGLGFDPISERKAVELADMTLRKALEDRIATKKLKPYTVTGYRSVAARAFADWLDKPMSMITSQMAIDRHRDITRKRGPGEANFAARVLSSAFGHARGAHGLQAPNPVTRMREGKLFNKMKPRDEFVDPHDLPAFMTTLRRLELAKLAQDNAEREAAQAAGVSWRGLRSRIAQTVEDGYATPMHYSGAADVVRVLLLTGFRLNEAQGLRWREVNTSQKVIGNVHDELTRVWG